ncbi:hypothetical protein [Bradyrhizobium quebecense]|uniref:Uncharacterized protein n=2 Tax=Bradyrhizobium quebecense TaxID=2748629 RepID=A0ABS3MF61_9BRAD|nr:hypothetical protein [Bradyrhizobium quebecense]UGY05373.1 hypothetical protein J4P68_0011825 [Bradyrhizobium quebecense]
MRNTGAIQKDMLSQQIFQREEFAARPRSLRESRVRGTQRSFNDVDFALQYRRVLRVAATNTGHHVRHPIY